MSRLPTRRYRRALVNFLAFGEKREYVALKSEIIERFGLERFTEMDRKIMDKIAAGNGGKEA